MLVQFHDYPFNIAKTCMKNLDKVLLPFNTYYGKPQHNAQANLLG